MKNEAGFAICNLTRKDRKKIAEYLMQIRKNREECEKDESEYIRRYASVHVAEENAVRHVLAMQGWKVKEGTKADGTWAMELVPRSMGKMEGDDVKEK